MTAQCEASPSSGPVGGTAASRKSLTHKLSVPRKEVFRVVEELALEISAAFEGGRGASQRFVASCHSIGENLRRMEPRVYELQAMAPRYDFDAATPGNGYRSLVCVIDTALVRLLQLMRGILAERNGFLFRASNYAKEIEAYSAILTFLAASLEIMRGYMDDWPKDSLFPDEAEAHRFTDLIESVEALDPSCFYGRAIGFHFCSSVSKVFSVVGMALAAYSVSWEKNTGPLSVSSLITSSRFLISPELRAKRIIDVVKHADISFCKGFWNLSEAPAISQLPDWVCPRLQVTREFAIPAAEPLYLERHSEAEAIDGVAYARIPPPAAHTGNRPVQARLLSNRWRPGMEKLLSGGKVAEGEAASPSLLFHCHGGGFVATTSKSHESYLRHWAKVGGGSRFLISPELRAKRIIDVVKHADISFCKGFWNLSEAPAISQLPDWVCPRLQVTREFAIPAAEPLYLERHSEAEAIDGVAYARIPPPAAHTGNRPVQARLLSNRWRPGMEKLLSGGKVAEGEAASPSLLFHCHGGGFVATTSKSHESYLRHWAKVLDAPVLSIDYALAPENPFPRALEEILYAYVWALNHASLLGWTGERVCVTGDSAGGNLLTAMVVHLIEMGVSRIPDGMVMTYAAFVFAYLPSPSRLLTVMDPLLPMGILLRCLAAYTGHSHLVEGSDVAPDGPTGKPKKTLQEYLDEMNRAPPTRLPTDQRIMSLVNLVQHSESAAANFAEIPPRRSPDKAPPSILAGKRVKFEVNEDGVGESRDDVYEDSLENIPPSPSHSEGSSEGSGSRRRTKSERPGRSESVESSSSTRLRRSTSWDSAPAHLASVVPEVEPEEEDTTEDPIVEIHQDPSRIWLASSVPSTGDGLVTFLARHHLTKDSLILTNSTASEAEALPAKAPLSASLSVRSLGFDDSSITLTSPERAPLPVPPPKPRQSLRRSVTSAFSTTLNVATGHAMDHLSGWIETPESLEGPGTLEAKAKECIDPTPTIVKLRKIKEPRTNLISPMITPPLILARLPPLHIVAGQLDPLLDDSIAFAKKARDAGAKKVTVDLLDGLPHGFLNFTLPSVECRHGAKLCLRRISQVLFPELHLEE